MNRAVVPIIRTSRVTLKLAVVVVGLRTWWAAVDSNHLLPRYLAVRAGRQERDAERKVGCDQAWNGCPSAGEQCETSS